MSRERIEEILNNKQVEPGINKVGRPCKFKSVKELQACADEYFKHCEDNNIKLTLTGFCVFIDSYRDYLQEIVEHKPEFAPAIKRIKEKIAGSYESGGVNGTIPPAIAIFMAKNLGYTDKTESDINIKGNLDLGSAFQGKK